MGQLTSRVELEADTLEVGSYLVKLDQPYRGLAKNLLELQDYPDARLRTYDDSGWTMGNAFNVDVPNKRFETTSIVGSVLSAP